MALEESTAGVVFLTDGTFTVTRFPFEIDKDDWGSDKFDPATGTPELIIEYGNFIPEDFDGSGSCSFDENGYLVLTGIWLGTPYGATGKTRRRHVFG